MSYDRLPHKPPKPPPQLAIGELGNISHRHCRDVVWRNRMALVQGLHSFQYHPSLAFHSHKTSLVHLARRMKSAQRSR